MSTPEVQQGPSRRRLIVFYSVLAIVATVVCVIAISAGQGVDPVKSIAGGYDVTLGADCLGPKVDIKQSGRFVSLGNPRGTVSGKLEVDKKGHLTGDVDCLKGGGPARSTRTRPNSELKGTLGGKPVSADLKRDPPAAGHAEGARAELGRRRLQAGAALGLPRPGVHAQRQEHRRASRRAARRSAS